MNECIKSHQPINLKARLEAMESKPHAVKMQFKENENGDIACPRCGCTDLEQFGIDGFECNNCDCRIS